MQAAPQSQEMRLGNLKHNLRAGFSTKEIYDINGEYLFENFQGNVWRYLHYPRVHLGASINLRFGTNQYYTGLTWHSLITKNTFFELSLGGEIHDGNIKISTKYKKALGSRLLFRESISFGYMINNQYNLSLLLDHASNARLSSPNSGITDVGFRIGYKF